MVQGQGRTSSRRQNTSAGLNARRGMVQNTMPRSLPSRLGASAISVSARPASAAGGFAAFPAGDTCWCAARPPFAAIARCACGSIAANPRGVFLTAPLPLFTSRPMPSELPIRSPESRPSPIPLRPPLPAPPRSSMNSPLVLDWSAISLSPAAIIFFVSDVACFQQTVVAGTTDQAADVEYLLVVVRKRQAAIFGRKRAGAECGLPLSVHLCDVTGYCAWRRCRTKFAGDAFAQ